MKLLWLTEEADAAGLGEAEQWSSDAASRLVERGHRIHQLALVTHAASTRTWSSPEHRTTAAPAGHFGETLQGVLATGPDLVHVMGRTEVLAPHLPMLGRHRTMYDAWDVPPEPLTPGSLDWARTLAARSGWLREALAGGLGRSVERLDCGVDTMRFRPDAAPAADLTLRAAIAADGRPRVLWLGTPSASRGAARMLDLLVALNARVSGVRLMLVGIDPEQPRAIEVLLAEAREMGLLDALCVLPSVATTDLPAVVATADVAIAPTPAPEPSGFHILQALAAGVPVVAHAAGSARELLVDRRHGRLVPAGNLPGFAQAVASLLQDPAWRGECAEQARLVAMERHDLEPSLFALEDLYHRLRTDAQHERRPAA